MIITFIFILAGILFLIGTLIYVKNKNNLQEIKPIDKSNAKKVKKTLSNLWGIDGFNNQVITINKGQHSIIVELESIEYSLLHEGERNNVDRELISIAQMLKFPIQFLEVKKQIELGDMLEEIKINTINANSNVKEYAKQIMKHLEQLQEDQNLFERKNYMVISSFNNRKTAEIELKEFYLLLRYHLLNIKVSTRLLNNKEILELIYEQLHKGNKNKVSDIEEKGGLELYVTSKKGKKLKPYKKRKKTKEENFFDNQPQLISILAPEVIQEKRDYIYMGDDKYARIFTLMVYPNYIEIGWLDDILNTIGDVDISTQVQVADERNVIKYLTHKVTKLQSDYLLFERQGNIEELHRLEENIQSFEEMRRNIQINNDKMFFIKITLRVNAENLKELNEKSKMLRDEFANRSCEIRPLYFKQLDALKETLPLNNNIINDNNRNMTTR